MIRRNRPHASVPHNLTFQAPINVATSNVVAPGTSETVQLKAPAAGEYTFACTLHQGWVGSLSSRVDDA
jgi:plastocyanin